MGSGRGGSFALAALLGLTGCGGLGEGDYVVYRIALTEDSPAASCFPNDEIPDDVKDDSTDIRSSDTFIIYMGAGENVVLDAGELALSGQETDDGYVFAGRVADVSYSPGMQILDTDGDDIDDSMDPMIDADGDGMEDGMDMSVDTDGDMLDDRFEDPLVDANDDGTDDRFKQIPGTEKFTNETKFDVDAMVDGSLISGTVKAAISSSCDGPNCPEDNATSCTRTSTFEGIEVDDVDIDVGANLQNPAP